MVLASTCVQWSVSLGVVVYTLPSGRVMETEAMALAPLASCTVTVTVCP